MSRGAEFHLGYFTKAQHAFEGWIEWQPLELWTTTITSLQGQGHDAPFFLLRNHASGEYFAGQLAWSANWQLQFQRDLKGIVTFRFGPFAEAPLRIIAPGETVRTPEVHLGHLSGDLDMAVQAMHTHVRRSVLPPHPRGTEGLIQFAVPGDQGYYAPFNLDSAKKSADVAAAIGAELFILDAYWWDVTGDWQPSAARFPDGLEPLVKYVREKGLRFGLYLEAEGGR
ncbi:MAG: alpha-galactosidase, partial [Candidatus Hydrogenedentes bacterium]|nr:alpha-galactosidase [Candidatus Hydrogenedentota bacterium]